MSLIWQNVKCTYLNNYLCIAKPTHIILNQLHYYQFTVSLDRCDWSGNTADNLYAKVCFLDETKIQI